MTVIHMRAQNFYVVTWFIYSSANIFSFHNAAIKHDILQLTGSDREVAQEETFGFRCGISHLSSLV